MRLRLWLAGSAILIALKLCGAVRAAWWLVTLPIWGPAALVVAAAILAVLGCLMLWVLLGGG
jgi:hypothetical protein